MSGFEVVGVILGAWPLITTAVNVYKATRDSRAAERLLLQLDTEEFIFRQFVHDLLSSDVSDADLIQLSDRNKPNAGLWRDKALHSKLKRRLGPEKSKLVLTALIEMDKLLTSLREKLISNDVDLRSHRQRFIAGMNQLRNSRPSSGFRQDLDSLTWHNMQLRRLFKSCISPDHLAQDKQTTSPPGLSADVLRENSMHANELYDAICDSYRCQCPSPHEANLGFRHDSRKLLDPSEPFELIFPIKDVSEEMSELYMKSPISMSPTEDPDMSDLSRRCWSRNNSVSPGREQRGRSVSFSNSQIGVENVGLIEDLCQLVKDLDDQQTSSTPNSCLGVLGAKSKKHTVRITSVDDNSPMHHSVVCMEDCLLPSEDWDLSRKTRMDLALSLSLAILQFYSTPWIDMWWTWKDFCMLKDKKSHVFVNRKFYSIQNPLNAISRQPSHSQLTSTFWAIYGEPILTRLGFALVELALGKRLSEFRSPNEDESQDEDMLDLQTAKDIVDRGLVLEETCQAYHDVVQACLTHQVTMPSELEGLKKELSAKHKNFQQDLEKFVVGPLRNFHTASWPQATLDSC